MGQLSMDEARKIADEVSSAKEGGRRSKVVIRVKKDIGRPAVVDLNKGMEGVEPPKIREDRGMETTIVDERGDEPVEVQEVGQAVDAIAALSEALPEADDAPPPPRKSPEPAATPRPQVPASPGRPPSQSYSFQIGAFQMRVDVVEVIVQPGIFAFALDENSPVRISPPRGERATVYTPAGERLDLVAAGLDLNYETGGVVIVVFFEDRESLGR